MEKDRINFINVVAVTTDYHYQISPLIFIYNIYFYNIILVSFNKFINIILLFNIKNNIHNPPAAQALKIKLIK